MPLCWPTLFVAFAAYGSFVPLRFREVSLAEAVQRFVTTPLVPLWRASRSDFITNVLLFVPIGFLLLGALAEGSRRAAVALALPVAWQPARSASPSSSARSSSMGARRRGTTWWPRVLAGRSALFCG